MIDPADTSAEDIFDCLSEAVTSVAGREEEIGWLAGTLRESARVVLGGPEGIGKSTVVRQALMRMAGRDPVIALRLDLDRHATFGMSIASLAQVVRTFAEGTSSKHGGNECPPLQIIGDSFAPRSKTGDAARVGTAESGSQSIDARSLGLHLDRFMRAAGSRNLRAVLVMESSRRLHDLVGAPGLEALEQSLDQQSHLAFVFCSRQTFLQTARAEFSVGKEEAMQHRALDRVNPESLAKWIEQKFGLAGVVAEGVGRLCAQLGGPRTSEVVELAKATLEAAMEVGRATGSAVRQAMGRLSQRDAGKSASQWAALSPEEQRLLSNLVRSGGLEPIEVGMRAGDTVATRAARQETEFALLKKGILEKLPSGQIFVGSSTLAYWSVEHLERMRGIRFAAAPSRAQREELRVRGPTVIR